VGHLLLSTTIPWTETVDTFLKDTQVNAGVKTGISMKLGVPLSWVSASLSIPQRFIQADYEIEVPANTFGNASGYALVHAIVASDCADGKQEWSEAITMGMTMASPYGEEASYQVAVHSVPSPAIRIGPMGANTAYRIRGETWSNIIRVLVLISFQHALQTLSMNSN